MPKPSSPPPPSEPTNPFADFFQQEMGHTSGPAQEEANQELTPATGASPADRLLRGQKAVLSLDRKGRRGKSVTLLTGIHLPPGDFEDLARNLRQSCGAGGTITGSAIEIQGDHRNRLDEYLSKRGVKVKRP